MSYLALLNTMLTDMKSAPAFYQTTPFWNYIVPHIVKDLETFGFENFRSLGDARHFWIDERNEELALEKYNVYSLLDNSSKTPYLQGFSESLIGKPLNAFEFDGRIFTSTSLNYLQGLVFLKNLVNTSLIQSVMEIGGGYGALGEIMLKAQPASYFYVNIDIPPLAAVSTYYLQTLFGKESVLDYEQSRQMETIDLQEIQKKYRAAVLCPWQLPKIKGSFDLSVNYISFQEMEPEVVRNYAQHMQTLTKQFVLLRNAREGKPLSTNGDLGVIQQTKREHYLDFFSFFKLKALNSSLFGHQTLCGFESEVMIFQKISN